MPRPASPTSSVLTGAKSAWYRDYRSQGTRPNTICTVTVNTRQTCFELCFEHLLNTTHFARLRLIRSFNSLIDFFARHGTSQYNEWIAECDTAIMWWFHFNYGRNWHACPAQRSCRFLTIFTICICMPCPGYAVPFRHSRWHVSKGYVLPCLIQRALIS